STSSSRATSMRCSRCAPNCARPSTSPWCRGELIPSQAKRLCAIQAAQSEAAIMTNSKPIQIDHHPGRTAQTIGIARELGTDVDLIHEPSIGVVGTKGDSQCYLGVVAKVDAIHASLKNHVGKGAGQMKLRLVQPEYTIATSD